MKICSRCNHCTEPYERIEKDPKKSKHWLITYCSKCGFNMDLEVYTGEVKSPQEEMDKYPWPPPPPEPPKNWYGY